VVNGLALVAFAVYAANEWRGSRRDAMEELVYINGLLAQSTRADFMQQASALTLVGQDLLRVGALGDPGMGQSILERVARQNPGVAGLGLARTDGQLVLFSGLPLGTPLPNLMASPTTRESFRQALNSANLQAGRPTGRLPWRSGSSRSKLPCVTPRARRGQ
jgi:hypothetical protein